MAARAGIRFSTRGAGRTIGKVQGVGASFGGLGKSSKSASFGIGRVAYSIYNTLARISMVRRGVTGMSREVGQAENKWRGWGRAVGGPFTSVLAGVSKKFAEVRRTIAFYILAAKDYVRWGKKMVGIKQKVPGKKGVPTAPAGAPPPVQPPPPGITGGFAALGKGYRLAATAAKILTGAVAALSVALAALYAYVGYKTTKMALGVVKGFMSIRETFREYEISLGGVVRNTKATAKIMKFATKYAAEYPAMFEDVVDAFRGLASMPTLKPMFRKADYDDLKGIMDIVQGLATLKPQQGVQGAMMALRESLSGQMRSLRMRFEVNVREMAEEAGFSFTEITHDANKALIAMRKFVELNVPAQAMASMAKTISVQWGNLYDKYKTFINDMMKSTGAYWAVVTALVHLNDWLEKVFKAPEVTQFAQKIGNALREITRVIEVAMGGFDLKSYLKRGDIVGAVQELCGRIGTLFSALWGEFGDKAKKAFKIVIDSLWSMLGPAFKMLAVSFWEMIEAGAADAGRISGRLFKIAFKGATVALGSWIGKKLITTEIPLSYWGKKHAAKKEAEKKGKDRGKEGVPVTPKEQVSAVEDKLKAQLATFWKKLGIAEKEPVDVGKDIVGVENKRLKAIKMALRSFEEWSDKYKWQKKDAEGLLAVTKKIADVLNIVSLKKEKLKAAVRVDTIRKKLAKEAAYGLLDMGIIGGKTRKEEKDLSKSERASLLAEEEQLRAKVANLTERINKAGVMKAEDLASLLQTGMKSRDAILDKEKKIVAKIKEAKDEMVKLNATMFTGLASTTVSFFNNWKKGFRLIKDYASIMSKTMIPKELFGEKTTKVTWKEGLRRKTTGKWEGVPGFLTTLISRMQGALTAEKGVAGKRSLTEGLMGLYKEAMSHARGRGPKAFITSKAMELLPKLLSFQAKEAKLAMAIQQGQYNELKAMRETMDSHTTLLNTQIAELQRVSAGGPATSYARYSRASDGNRKITAANPVGHPFLGNI